VPVVADPLRYRSAPHHDGCGAAATARLQTCAEAACAMSAGPGRGSVPKRERRSRAGACATARSCGLREPAPRPIARGRRDARGGGSRNPSATSRALRRSAVRCHGARGQGSGATGTTSGATRTSSARVPAPAPARSGQYLDVRAGRFR
jgi:hypothetical protein